MFKQIYSNTHLKFNIAPEKLPSQMLNLGGVYSNLHLSLVNQHILGTDERDCHQHKYAK